MSGYTVANSIALIDEYCNNPSIYNTQQLRVAVNDAYVHYQYGNASKQWYDSVVRVLTPYI